MTDAVLARPGVADLLAAASSASTRGDLAEMNRVGDALERLEAYDHAWTVLSEVGLRKKKCGLPEWQGNALDGEELLVERRIRHVGAELRMARFIACATATGAQVVVRPDKRLVPLFRRSFPAASVIEGDGDSASLAPRAVVTSYEGLARRFGATGAAIGAAFIPLVPDAERQLHHRRCYTLRGLPVIGIAWHSTNARKDLPGLEEWAGFLRKTEATFVSLQYREDEFGIDELCRLSGRTILRSGEVDQLQDIDGFAAQVAAVDAVVTISNTTAHMAGALGIPAFVLLDDKFHLSWPCDRATTPFYPRMQLVRQAGRSWTTVFTDLDIDFTRLEHDNSPQSAHRIDRN